MERRLKEARESSLQELKRLRSEGGARKPNQSDDDDNDMDMNVKDLLRTHSSDDEFIEHLSEPAADQEATGRRPTASVTTQPAIDVKRDEFFSHVLAQLDQDCNDAVTATLVSEAAEIDWDEPLPDFPAIPPPIDLTKVTTLASEPEPPSVADLGMGAVKADPAESVGGDATAFYWIDAHERPNGGVFLFGLARDPSADGPSAGNPSASAAPLRSACVTVKNMQRNVYLLPRETIDDGQPNCMELVRAELDALLASHRIAPSSVSLRRVSRRYTFEVPGIPTEADWIKVSYPYAQPAISCTAGRTFSHVFGAHTSPLEMFIVKRRIMGPSWLSLRSAAHNKTGVSWCSLEFQVDSAKQVSVQLNPPPAPGLTVLSLKLCCVPTKGQHEIVAAAGVVFKGVSVESNQDYSKPAGAFSVVREDGPNQALPCASSAILHRYGSKGRLEVAKSERALLSYLIAVIHRWDPDVIVGHNLLATDLGVLLQRFKHHQTSNWSRLGRLHWTHWPRASKHDASVSFAERQVTSGRLLCDTLLGAREHVRAKNYVLGTLVDSQLGVKDYQPFNMDSLLYAEQLPISAAMVVEVVRSAESDAFLQAQLAFRLHLLGLSKQLTNIAGNLWNRTLMGARAERNEYLFLHEFHNLKYVLPDKRSFKDTDHDDPDHHHHSDNEQHQQQQDERVGGGRRKPAYSGGLVLDPKRGFYTSIVMLLDFNSLYPSLIQEFNICFTTVERSSNPNEVPQVPDAGLPQGILPRIIHSLVQRRRQVKSLLKDPKLGPAERAQLDTRQQALKLTANSMYGCLGFTHSRFHARALAALITAKGREVLQSTVHLATTHLHLDVIYGDTDSVMVDTGLQDPTEVRALAARLKGAVNERYKCLEIELDGLFRRLLLLKKKKYAALKLQDDGVSCVLETKGLDMVRRDWCPLSVEACNFCLQQIMAGGSAEADLPAAIRGYLISLHQDICANRVPVDKYVICKNLTRDPSLYADAKGHPHVAVALRLKDKGESMQAGATVQYVICKAALPSASISERAFHVEEVKREPTLAIDTDWYVQQQLIPPLGRLCEFVPGVDQGFLAACFNLDTRKYAIQLALPLCLQPRSHFTACSPLLFHCPACQQQFEFAGRTAGGLDCTHCGAALPPPCALHQLHQVLRKLQSDLYQQRGQCDECGAKTRCIRMYPQRCADEECSGSVSLMISAGHFYNQLLYYCSLFEDGKDGKNEAPPTASHSHPGIDLCLAVVKQRLAASAYPIVSLGELFRFTIK